MYDFYGNIINNKAENRYIYKTFIKSDFCVFQ